MSGDICLNHRAKATAVDIPHMNEIQYEMTAAGVELTAHGTPQITFGFNSYPFSRFEYHHVGIDVFEDVHRKFPPYLP
jgi:hypothetical protein